MISVPFNINSLFYKIAGGSKIAELTHNCEGVSEAAPLSTAFSCKRTFDNLKSSLQGFKHDDQYVQCYSRNSLYVYRNRLANLLKNDKLTVLQTTVSYKISIVVVIYLKNINLSVCFLLQFKKN